MTDDTLRSTPSFARKESDEERLARTGGRVMRGGEELANANRAVLQTTLASAPAITGRGLADVMAERVRQIDDEGFTLDHDLLHHPGELALAAASYANTAIDQLHGKEHDPKEEPDTWPWQREAWRPGTPRENIVKATAILLAVLDRIDAAPAGPVA